MPGRRDALCAAAEAVLAVEIERQVERQPRHRRDHGRLPRPPRGDQQHPRSGDPRDRRPRHRPRPPRSASCKPSGEAIDAIAARRQVAAVVECLNSDPPASTSGIVVEAIRAACGELGIDEPVDDQPRLSRLALHGPDRADRNDLHPLQGRDQPPPRRVQLARGDRPRDRGAGARARPAGGDGGWSFMVFEFTRVEVFR